MRCVHQVYLFFMRSHTGEVRDLLFCRACDRLGEAQSGWLAKSKGLQMSNNLNLNYQVKNLATIGENTFTKNSVAYDLYYYAVVYGIPASFARRKAEAVLAGFERVVSRTASQFGMDEADFQVLQAEALVRAEKDRAEALATLEKMADLSNTAPVWVEASFHVTSALAEKAKKRSKFAYAEVVEVAHPHLEKP